MFALNIDTLTDYITSKKTGTARPIETEKSETETVYRIAKKQWDPNTGEELEERVIAVDKKELLTLRGDLVAQIASIDAFLKDVDPVITEDPVKHAEI